MYRTFTKFISIVILISVLICGCQDKSNDLRISLIDFIIEPNGENCLNGGIKLIRGFDDNFNNILDQNEIEEINYICNGLDGNNALQKTYKELPGENCPNGGLKVISGLDLNSNDSLEENEMISTDFICQDISYLDNEIVINLTPGSGLINADSNPLFYQFLLPSFDIRNYQNISSIKLIVFGVVTCSSFGGPDVDAMGSFELYDFTNNKVISHSLVKSDDIPKTSYITSSNFINDFPKEEIRLGIKITSDGQYITQCNGLYLLISRN